MTVAVFEPEHDHQDQLVAWLGAFAVHAFAVWLMVTTLALPGRDIVVPAEPEVIEAEVIDARVLEAEAQRLRDQQSAERRAVEQAAAVAETKRIELARMVAENEAAERRARDAAVAEKKAAAAQQAREAAQQKRDAAAQVQREQELRAQLAAEERQRKAERSAANSQYIAAVQQKVRRNWLKPAVLPVGLECLVRVEQLPTGDVVKATVVSCNGDEIVRRSIEDAVLKASPLPVPSDRTLYSRVVEFNFKPTK